LWIIKLNITACKRTNEFKINTIPCTWVYVLEGVMIYRVPGTYSYIYTQSQLKKNLPIPTCCNTAGSKSAYCRSLVFNLADFSCSAANLKTRVSQCFSWNGDNKIHIGIGTALGWQSSRSSILCMLVFGCKLSFIFN
jgi:hypothetical protein